MYGRCSSGWSRAVVATCATGLVFVALTLAAAPADAAGGCVGVTQGVTIPVAAGEEGGDWRMGPHWQLDAGVCIPVADATILAVGVAVEVAQASVDDVAVTSVEVGPAVSVMFKVAPVLIGVSLGSGPSFSADPRPRRTLAAIAPAEADALTEPLATIAIDAGAVLWWPLREWASLVLAVDVDVNPVRKVWETEEGVAIYGGPPPVSVVPRLGVLFAF